MILLSAQKISLKNHPSVNEDMIQRLIFENPSVLGFGDLIPLKREKVQPSGGRLDLLLADDETHYEVEVMLGATEPSHIIRTIEYWDIERKRYPQIDHCAVIVAEEITERFMILIFYPRQKSVKINIKCPEETEFDSDLNARELDFEYSSKKRRYQIRVTKKDEYEKNRDIFKKMIMRALEMRDAEE